MIISDSFTFSVNGDVCDIVTHSYLPTERLKSLLDFVFRTYAPIAAIAQSIGNNSYTYTIAQSGDAVDVLRLLQILGRYETGWNLSDGIIFSPRPSKIRPTTLMQAIGTARMAVPHQ
jgi:hypothetical protein